MSVFLYGAAAFGIGALLAFVDYCISVYFLKHHSDRMAMGSIIRQTINLIFLFVLFWYGQKYPSLLWALLVGGAAGLTLPSVLLTQRLLKRSGQDSGKEQDNG